MVASSNIGLRYSAVESSISALAEVQESFLSILSELSHISNETTDLKEVSIDDETIERIQREKQNCDTMLRKLKSEVETIQNRATEYSESDQAEYLNEMQSRLTSLEETHSKQSATIDRLIQQCSDLQFHIVTMLSCTSGNMEAGENINKNNEGAER
ncbi:hypothetical protein BKA69DRAFT_1073265 [Paraphysoderma sedebokerense]|nr:hypothetical protein BKA69DRAFT_1073265 [Paraphysoderma sedebokerense]